MYQTEFMLHKLHFKFNGPQNGQRYLHIEPCHWVIALCGSSISIYQWRVCVLEREKSTDAPQSTIRWGRGSGGIATYSYITNRKSMQVLKHLILK